MNSFYFNNFKFIKEDPPYIFKISHLKSAKFFKPSKNLFGLFKYPDGRTYIIKIDYAVYSAIQALKNRILFNCRDFANKEYHLFLKEELIYLSDNLLEVKKRELLL